MPANVSTNAMRVDFQASFQQYSDKKMTAIQQPSSLECCKRVQQRTRWVQLVLLKLLGFDDSKIIKFSNSATQQTK